MYNLSITSSKITTHTSRQTVQHSDPDPNSAVKPKEKPIKLIFLLVHRLITNRKAEVYERIRLMPIRQLRMQRKIKNAIEGVFRRQDYLAKWEAFQNIRRAVLSSQRKQHEQLKSILKKQRGTAIRLITHFMLGKKRSILHTMLGMIRERADIRQHQINNNFRKGFRSMGKIFARKMSDILFRIKDSRVIMWQSSKVRSTVRILKEIRIQNIRWAFALMRREMIRNRQERAKEQIQELDQKLACQEDEEITGLENRYKELCSQLQEVKKDREEIQARLEREIKQAEDKKTAMKQHLDHLRSSQEEMKKKIEQIDEQLKSPFSATQIYQLCYENLLWTVAQNKEKTFNRDELLRSLEVPLVPIDLPLDQLKEQNKILKDLISEYVVMYGEKRLPPGSKLELPYQYLLKENNLLYKMLMTLLPNAQLLREELHTMREAYESVQKMVKECTLK